MNSTELNGAFWIPYEGIHQHTNHKLPGQTTRWAKKNEIGLFCFSDEKYKIPVIYPAYLCIFIITKHYQ
jgi:hypothetical protein